MTGGGTQRDGAPQLLRVPFNASLIGQVGVWCFWSHLKGGLMHSSLIGKIQKAHLYAQEPARVEVREFTASFRGEHDTYNVTYHDGQWQCSCTFFPQWGVCSHIMATQRLMGPIAPHDAVTEQPQAVAV
jgi:hypothetical protein